MADVSNFAEFATAVSLSDPAINLTGNTYTMTAGVNLDHTTDITIDASVTGDVTFSGEDTYDILVYDKGSGTTTINFIGEATKRIVFTGGLSYGFRVRTLSANILHLTMSYCDFRDNANAAAALFAVGGNLGFTKVTLNNCNAFNGLQDGYSMLTDAGGIRSELHLNSCTAYDNSPTGAGDGITAHSPNQRVFVNGGLYYKNGKSGCAVQGGSFIMAKDVEFYNNGGGAVHLNVSISESYGVFDNCKVYITAGATAAEKQATLTVQLGGFLVMRDCDLDGTNATVNYVINFNLGSTAGEAASFTFDQCTIHDITSVPNFSVGILDVASEGIRGAFTNCTFYNNKPIYTATPQLTFWNNIFDVESGEAAFYSPDGELEYSGNPTTGYNVFWGRSIESDYFTNVGGESDGFTSTDFQSDPQFADPDNGDFTPQNPLVFNGGKPDINGNPTTMGAVIQNDSVLEYSTIKNSIILAEG